jgi:nucleotide-binding universal stress UspA family protein
MTTILAPIDFSDVSECVLAEAIELARATGARLVLLHVVQPLARMGGNASLAESGVEFASLAESEAGRRLTELQRKLREGGVVAHAVLRSGFAGQCIVQQAERLQADYIVIGSHGHTAFYDLIVGSTTTRVLKEASCRVVIVPPGAKAGLRRRTEDRDRMQPTSV